MKTKKVLALVFFLIISVLSGCATKNESDASEYQTITAKEAKTMMDTDSEVIILDVRTEEEYDSGHISDALLIPDIDIKDQAEVTLTDKAATILVYCRSGRRSALAAKDLVDLGYTNVYDFGGILDWEYEVVAE
jgi:rhodanese-related sulfurtransferase